MRITIQKKFFAWLALQTTISFLTIGAVVFIYNLVEERQEHNGDGFGLSGGLSGEAAESAIFIGLLLLLLPTNILSAWFISKILLHPWRNLNQQAMRISAGELEERIHVENPSDEIGQLSTALNTAFDRHHELLERVRRIGFDVSHQLRNPLASIQTFCEVCLHSRRTPEEYEETLGEVLESANRLRRTTDQLLMLARSAGALSLEQRELVCLQSMVKVVMKEASMIGGVRRITVELQAPDEPIYVHGVSELLQTALSNLVDNALRVSPEGGTIVISLLSSDKTVRIGVQDEGNGLSPAQESTLFSPRKRNADTRNGSVGLGLSIVSDISKAHSGTVGFRNLKPRGCLFWVELAVANETK